MTEKTRPTGYVRVDIFKDTGKWYSTGWVDMAPWFNTESVHGAVREACNAEATKANGEWGLVRNADEYFAQGWTIVCTEPHHQFAHPVLLAGLRGLTHTAMYKREGA